MRATALGQQFPLLLDLQEAVDAQDYPLAADVLRRLATTRPDQGTGMPVDFLLVMAASLTEGFADSEALGAMFERGEFVGSDGEFLVVGEIVPGSAGKRGGLAMIAGHVLATATPATNGVAAVRTHVAGMLPSVLLSGGSIFTVQPILCAGAINAEGSLFLPAHAWRFARASRGPTLIAGAPSRATLPLRADGEARTWNLKRGANRAPAASEEAKESTRRPTQFDLDYRLPAGIEKNLRKQWGNANLWRSIAVALCDIGAIPLLVAVHWLLAEGASNAPFALAVWMIGYPVTLLLVARQFRALEALVHEAAHYNWTRDKPLNDRIADYLAATPVIQTVKAFRASHQVHHEHLGDDEDPCQRRFQVLWAKLDRGSVWRYAKEMARVMGTYMESWWRLVGSNSKLLITALAWHIVVFIVPGAFVLEFAAVTSSVGSALSISIGLWLRYVVIGFVVVLPVLRFIAEAAKHDYANGTTTRDGTFSNIGPIHWLLHPNGDAYHFLHHVAPWIVHHQARAAHRWLFANDPNYAAGRTRRGVFENPAMPAKAAEVRSRRHRSAVNPAIEHAMQEEPSTAVRSDSNLEV
ncbi:MAG: fatty acid desaturase [Gemmatimonadaceae bacterium]|nr:fatty acid desaturase [Gemmatimonadaceae bacterium]